MKKIKLISLFVLATCFTKISAQINSDLVSDKWEWSKIADKTVGDNRNRDDIVITGNDRYTAIKVLLKESELNLYALELSYAGGNGQVIDVSTEMKAGNETKVFGLCSFQRDLLKIKFVYETIRAVDNEKTKIEVWGLRTISPEMNNQVIEN
ncbi:MAG: hypothetical protein IPP56_12770 [Bacteroidetes bacterium]|nr:hypothetical protein [Bacteroidota bacterium]MBK9671648.1 hypothetical protein [Bacteroidota bacterium]MBK9800540.1 hypothetical protein [Bacteroidota bacterium]MBP6412125.1 hypothetical protein [Bacteroidia bacterium]